MINCPRNYERDVDDNVGAISIKKSFKHLQKMYGVIGAFADPQILDFI